MNVENPIIDHIGELREYDPQGQLARERELWKCPGQGLVRLYRAAQPPAVSVCPVTP